MASEQARYEQEVAEVKNWWKDSRWRYTKRPFTAEEIVQKRGTLKISYPSNDQSKKLWKILEQRFAEKTCSATYGCLDPVMVTQMAKYLDTIYVSGWQSSSTASSTNEPSPDLADYPMVRNFPARSTSEFLPMTQRFLTQPPIGHRSQQGRPSLQGPAFP